MGDRYRHRRPRYYDDDESDTSEVDNYPPPKPRRSGRDARPPPPPAGMPSDLPPPPAPMPQQTSDDDEYAPRDRDRRRAAPRVGESRRHDLEAKNGEGHQRFRAKRDGYESDEGENLRRSRRAQPPPAKPRPYPDDDEEFGRPARQERSLPLRGKPRDPIDNGVEYGGAAVPADRDGGAIRRRRTYKDPSPRDRQGYDDYDSPRRPERRFDDPGYRSDHGRRAPRPRPRRDYDDDDYDRAPPRRRDDGYRSGGERRPRPQDYYSDHREDRAPRRGDPRRYPREDRDRYYDDRRRDSRYDDYDRRDPRDKRKSAGGWQKEAQTAFMAYAMPTIKKEGTKWAKKQLQSYMAKKGGGL